MSNELQIPWRDRVGKSIRAELYLSYHIPAFVLASDDEPKPELFAEVFRETWNEFVELIRDRYMVTRKMEEGLAERLKEAWSQTEHYGKDIDYYSQEKALIEEDAHIFGGDTSLSEALEDDTLEFEQRGWMWTAQRSHYFHIAPDNENTHTQVAKHRLPRDLIQNPRLLNDDEVHVPMEGTVTYSPNITLSAAAEAASWLVNSATEQLHRTHRTADFINFRLQVLRNVIYRFETLGDVAEITLEEAQQALDDGGGTKVGRPPELDHERFEEAVLHTLADDKSCWHESGEPNKRKVYDKLNRTLGEYRGVLNKSWGDPITYKYASELMKKIFERIGPSELDELRQEAGVTKDK